jgi:hypothetical protein
MGRRDCGVCGEASEGLDSRVRFVFSFCFLRGYSRLDEMGSGVGPGSNQQQQPVGRTRPGPQILFFVFAHKAICLVFLFHRITKYSFFFTEFFVVVDEEFI